MYLAVDIETTGLDPEKHQVLEIACVLDEDRPIMECDTFRALIDPGEIVGTPTALSMNAELIQRIADDGGYPPHHAAERLYKWMSMSGFGPDNRVDMLGKNVGSFDWQFLKRVRHFPMDFFSHRFLDVGSMYASREGIPSQSEIARDLADQLDIPGKEHEALYDARVSLALARLHWGTPL